MERAAFAVPADGLVEAGAQGQEMVDPFVRPDQTVEGFVRQSADRLLDVGLAEEVRLPLDLDAIVLLQPGFEDAGEDDPIGPPAAHLHALLPAQILPAQAMKQLDSGDERIEVFEVGEFHRPP
jgi:hypothetical protein